MDTELRIGDRVAFLPDSQPYIEGFRTGTIIAFKSLLQHLCHVARKFGKLPEEQIADLYRLDRDSGPPHLKDSPEWSAAVLPIVRPDPCESIPVTIEFPCAVSFLLHVRSAD